MKMSRVFFGLFVVLGLLLAVVPTFAQDVTDAGATVDATVSAVPVEPTVIAEPTLPAPVDMAQPIWIERVLNSPVSILFIAFGGIALIAILVISYLLLSKAIDRLYHSNPAEAKQIAGAAGLAGTNLYQQFQERARKSPEEWDDLVLAVAGPIIEEALKRLTATPTTTITPEVAAAIRSRSVPVPHIVGTADYPGSGNIPTSVG